MLVSGDVDTLGDGIIGFVARPTHAIMSAVSAGGHMSLWSRFLDWILGRNIMTIDDLEAVERMAVESLEAMFENVNEKIDTDENGMVSVREAWVLMRDSVAWVRAITKRMLKCPTIKK